VQMTSFGLDAQCLWRCLVYKRTGSRGKKQEKQTQQRGKGNIIMMRK